jgi:membrane fusion protein (multidrug efflux system)
MAYGFSRSMRSLEADGFGRAAPGFALFGAIAIAWGAWILFAHVEVYELTDEARLEVRPQAYSIDAPVSGRVLASRLMPPRNVNAGEVLLELDAEPERLRLVEERARLVSMSRELEVLRSEIVASTEACEAEREAATAEVHEIEARQRETEADAKLADHELKTFDHMASNGVATELQLRHSQAAAERSRATTDALRHDMARAEWQKRNHEGLSRARLDELKRDETVLCGRLDVQETMVKRLDYEYDRFRVRAPTAGSLGEVAVVERGAFVREGDKLGVVVPPGSVKVVAQFRPSSAFGRLREGQHAKLRLEGFPWTQYGSLAAKVAHVANETRGGRVRVELDLEANESSPIPLEHGLPGSVEVEVERVAPAVLLMRAVGRILAAPTSRTAVRGDD